VSSSDNYLPQYHFSFKKEDLAISGVLAVWGKLPSVVQLLKRAIRAIGVLMLVLSESFVGMEITFTPTLGTCTST
jgi:hypothetical protein